jgi:hypothetical protein
MPILINEVVAEVIPGHGDGEETSVSAPPLPAAELEWVRTLALIDERRERLKID